MEEKKKQRKRPRGVTIIAMLFLLFGVPLILFFPFYVIHGGLGDVIAALIFIILFFVPGIGLLRLKDWARKIAICSIWLLFIYAIGQQFSRFPPSSGAQMIGGLLIVAIIPAYMTRYLTKSEVKAAFTPELVYAAPSTPLPQPPTTTMYCPSCGTELRPDTKFCPSCGTPVKEHARGDVSNSYILSLINKLDDPLTDVSLEESESVIKELVKIGKPAVPLLIQNIRKNGYIPIILGEIRDPRALEPLMELAKSPGTFETDPIGTYEWYAAEYAIKGLGFLGDRRAIPLLVKIIKETSVAELYQAAAKAKEKVELKKMPLPSDIFKDKGEWELERMAEDKGMSKEVLDKLADHPSWDVRALVALNPNASVETLRKLSRKTGTAEGPSTDRNVHFQLTRNPSCPPDVLAFIEKCSIGDIAEFVKAHSNYRKLENRR